MNDDQPEVIEKKPEAKKSDQPTQEYFFPNDGQPFSCQAASREEAEKMNETYLKSLTEDK